MKEFPAVRADDRNQDVIPVTQRRISIDVHNLDRRATAHQGLQLAQQFITQVALRAAIDCEAAQGAGSTRGHCTKAEFETAFVPRRSCCQPGAQAQTANRAREHGAICKAGWQVGPADGSGDRPGNQRKERQTKSCHGCAREPGRQHFDLDELTRAEFELLRDSHLEFATRPAKCAAKTEQRTSRRTTGTTWQ